MLLIVLIILMQFIDFTKQLKKDSIKQNLRNKIWVKIYTSPCKIFNLHKFHVKFQILKQ